MQKKKLFLISGMMRAAKNWEKPIAVLRDELKEIEIIPLELPGMGKMHHESSPINIKNYVHAIRPYFLENKGDENFLLGFSLGGMVTSMWTKLYPEDFKGVILVTTSFSHLQPFWKRFKPRQLPAMSLALFAKGKLRENLLYNTICNNKDNKEELLKLWLKIEKEFPTKPINIIKQLLAGLTFDSKLIPKEINALVLMADKDKLVKAECSENIHKYLNATFFNHPTAGHDILNDDPNWAADKIGTWLREQ